jgi:hypothetical protein
LQERQAGRSRSWRFLFRNSPVSSEMTKICGWIQFVAPGICLESPSDHLESSTYCLEAFAGRLEPSDNCSETSSPRLDSPAGSLETSAECPGRTADCFTSLSVGARKAASCLENCVKRMNFTEGYLKIASGQFQQYSHPLVLLFRLYCSVCFWKVSNSVISETKGFLSK